jgi:hypothetical protein
MKNDGSKMKKDISLCLLIRVVILVLFLSLNIYAQTTPFFVMSPQDKEQYIYTQSYWEYGSSSSTKSFHQTAVNSMVQLDGIRFYKGYCVNPSIYFGMDEANNKLYFLRDSVKIMMIDFNIVPEGSFIGQFPGESTSHNITVTGSDSVRYYYFYRSHAQGGESTEYRIERRLGFRQRVLNYSISNGRGFGDDYSTFNLIRFNQNGDTLYKTQTWAPIISFTPEVTTKVFLKTFNVNTTHDVNNLFAQYIPNINFNDSLWIQYFYTNGPDTTAAAVKRIAAATPVTTFALQLDSMKMKAGYKFKYRYTLRDKFYRPKFAFHPSSTGYNTLSCDSTLLSSGDSSNITTPPTNTQIPVSIDLRSFPNPVSLNNNLGNQSATIRFNMLSAGHAKGTLYDILGRPVADILDADFPVGENSIKFNAEGLSSGMYVFRLATKSGSEFIKILVTK